ncbi:hypothetical protein [Candidatus Albibeggiatoa sp. nov. NOAA]|uniref:glycosyltransferase family 39 protein n=1 Tax=Candidatus Albibeggiatoa sp. nov. NOAA TaxID=3162724 RepID=UPI00330067C2|nr:glycosyltransferase family 39 protein [Thiotrichaceae bacterium]
MQIRSKPYIALILFLLGIGLFTHIESFRSTDRLLNSVSEDGYLMLTVARNVALGQGLSVSDGTIMTNGIQPATTFLWAGIYWLNEADKINSIVWITITQFIIALASTIVLWLLVKATIQKHAYIIASLAALTWFASPVYAGYTMNGLETGLNVLVLLIISLYFIKKPIWSNWDSILLGLLVGFGFLVRNDAVFMGFALYVTYLLLGQEPIKQRVWKAHVMGIVAFIGSIPWSAYNYLYFGSIFPTSSAAQSLIAEFGQNWQQLIFTLTEYSFTFIRVPNKVHEFWLFTVFCIIFLASLIFILIRHFPKLSKTEQKLLVLASIYILGLSIFYGLLFGAPYSLGRYLFPTTIFLVILWASLAIRLYFWLREPILRYGLVLSFCTIILGLTIKNDILKPRRHLHFQVVEWVQNNVDKQQWIGAVQSGAVGYFHDRTINLDGKVNPYALEARKQKKLPEYIIEQKLAYVADWAGLMLWLKLGYPKITAGQQVELLKYYRVVEHDENKNLAVFKRYRD